MDRRTDANKGRGPKEKGRGPRAEGRGPRAKGQGLRAKGQGLRAKGQGLRAEGQGPSAEGGSHQKSKSQDVVTFTDASRGDRLHKVLATAGIASRRDCEKLITDGRVTVNGQVVDALPAWADPTQDRIEVDGQPLARPRSSARRDRVYLMLHKPKNIICTTDDPQGRPTVLDLIDPPPPGRIYPVGRLDADSTGLILLTNDGDLAQHVTHPRFGLAKQYKITVRGRLTEQDVTKLRQGLYLAAGRAKSTVKKASMTQVEIQGQYRDRTHGDRTNLLVTLQEGQNREIRRMMVRLGYRVGRLQRVAIGPLRLRGLAPGQWRRLTPVELGKLRRQTGLQRGER